MSSDRGGPPPDEVELERSGLMGAPVERAEPKARSRKAKLLQRGGVFVALALVVTALIYSVHSTMLVPVPGRATPTAIAVFLSTTGLGCVQSAAWDPTSTSIALVGSTNCGSGAYATNVINIYRASTAALVRQLRPDAAVFAALGMPQPTPATPITQGSPHFPQLTYQMLSWSPDGTRLAITFVMFSGFSTSNVPQLSDGLVLLDADGSRERVLVDKSQSSAPPTTYEATYTVWDTQSGTLTGMGSAPVSSTDQYVIPNALQAALSYTWDSGGALVPGAPLSASGKPPSASLDLVGNPDGGARFGLWQPGQVQVYAASVAGQQAPVYLYVFQTSFAAWSPDGRYFADDLSMSGLLLPSGQSPPSQSVLNSVQLDQAVTLPLRDAALEQALVRDIPLPSYLGTYPSGDVAPIAWRPDGKVLAIPNQDNGFTLRSTATGQVVKSVRYIERPPSSLAPPGAFGTSENLLLWSPDGTWLLLPSLGLVHVGLLNV